MRRHTIAPRRNWQQKVEEVGLLFHSVEGQPYWDESAYWEFSSEEIDRIEAATAELQEMCLKAGDAILEKDLWQQMAIPEKAIEAIRATWTNEPPALYGRMDFAYDGKKLKLLEYNADTPTSLLESAVVQWYWLEESFPEDDQFNSIHEKLIAKWDDLKPYVQQPIYFTCDEDADPSGEDRTTVEYLRDTAHQAGLRTSPITMKEIGWHAASNRFVDQGAQPMGTIFKLYPWEWMLEDSFGPYALDSLAQTQWIEPIWKMLWSNKGLLAVLWELYPEHELLLPAYLDGPRDLEHYAEKPLLGREGANVRLVRYGVTEVQSEGKYGKSPKLYQELASLAQSSGNYAVLGSWLIDGESCGMGIRESSSPITTNTSRFVPHLFR
jgi:glutathionylspermidine synthase